MREKHWRDLVPVSELEKNDVTPAKHGSLDFAVYDTVDGIFVSLARCSHQGANLCYGYFDGKTIECPLHQGLFDARTGEPKASPATRKLIMIEARVHEGVVQILK